MGIWSKINSDRDFIPYFLKSVYDMNNHNMNIESDMVKGLISVNYANYRVNRGIKDSIFED